MWYNIDMETICGKCGGKIEYKKVLKEEKVKVEKESGCCLWGMLMTFLTCGLNIVFSILFPKHEKVTRCLLRGTCTKCGKVYEYYINNEEDDDSDDDENEDDSYPGMAWYWLLNEKNK